MLKVKKLVEKFLEWCEKALSKATFQLYRFHLGKFLESLKIELVRNLRPAHLTAWAKSWHQSQAVIRCFNWAVNEARIIKVNPFAKVKKPRRGARKRIITEHDTTRFIRSAGPAGRKFLIALRETLARPQEIRAARFEDLVCQDLEPVTDKALIEGKALIVFHQFKDHDRRSDTDRARVLLVSKRLGRMIIRIAAARGNREGPIWMNERGLPWTRNAVRCLLRRLRVRLKIPKDHRGENVVAYTFRHSQATLAASRGLTDRTLADLLGHVETRTTSRYLHLQVKHLRHAIDDARNKKTR